MIPQRVEDPRDNLEKATRWELYAYAKAVGCTEVYEPMPAILAVQILRARGFTNIKIPDRPLGAISVLGKDPYQPATQTVDAVAELARQFAQQQAAPEPIDTGKMKFNEIRSELKRRGVRFSRKDNLEVLKAKLDGESHPS